MAQIVIIGAGLTGLSAAYHLEAAGFFDYKIFEKESHVGGLCSSTVTDGYTFDYTGHLLHINNDYFRSFIEKIVGLESLNAIQRKSFIYSHNRYTRYPFQVNLHGLPTDVIAECIESYVTRPQQKKILSFKDWVIKNFGKGMGKHFFFPYQTKIFDFPITKLSHSWTGRFVPKTSLKDMIEGALTDSPQEDIGYNAQFFYPKKGGIVSWLYALEKQLLNSVNFNHQVKNVDLIQKRVHFTNGHSEPFTQLISTIPLDTFIALTKAPSSLNLTSAQANLKCNSVVNFNLGINRPNLSERHWIYFPETKYPFYRLGFPHNFSASMAPNGCSSLYGEFSHLGRSQKTIDTRLSSSLKSVKELFSISPREIDVEVVLPISHAYVIYDDWRDKNLPHILAKLSDHNVSSIGRYGAWKYSSMQEGILDGKSCVEELLKNVDSLKKKPTLASAYSFSQTETL